MKNVRLVVSLMVLAAGGAAVVVGCSGGPEPTPAKTYAKVAMPAMTDDKPRDYPGLHNVVAYHDGFLSGSVPEGEAAFDTLAGMGIKTIISVDGAETEVDKAEARGIRYIHLPIAYNGFDDKRKVELVRAVRDAMAKGPVYLHCHHGKHRSAGAAGTVAVSLGWMTNDAAIQRMKVSGTAPGYTGLYACTASAGMLAKDVVDAVNADFPSVQRPKGTVKTMVEIDIAMENLKAIEKAGWQPPADHPALAPAAEAGKLADLLRFLETDTRTTAKGGEYLGYLKKNNATATALEEMLMKGAADKKALSDQFKLVAAGCKDCHTKYRDDPAAQ